MLPDTPRLTRMVSGGRVVPWWRANRVRLPHELMNCVAYLYCDRAAAETGDTVGAATAFWVSQELTHADPSKSQHVPFLVTNRHVIEEGTSTLRWIGKNGQSEIREIPEDQWFFPSSNDLDVALWSPRGTIEGQIFPIANSSFLSMADFHDESIDIRIGDDIFMIGRHLNYDGKLTNTPTARFGHLVQLPYDRITDDKGRSCHSYLVQIPSLPGFSGSPVFLYQDELEKDAERMAMTVGRPPRIWRLLGINVAHLPAYNPTYRADNNSKNEHLIAKSTSGVNAVLPSWFVTMAIFEFLNSRLAF